MSAKKPANKRRRLRKLLLLTAISSIAAIVIAEVSLRIASAALHPPLYELHAALGWQHVPDVHSTFTDEEGRTVPFVTDAQGLRIDPDGSQSAAATRTVLFVGDSFTQASQVEAGESFVGVVDRELATACCLNAGVGGYSTLQQRLALPAQLAHSRPNVVVLVIYENDFVDNLMPYFSGLGPRPFARCTDGVFAIEHELDIARFEPFLQPAPAAFWLYQHSAIYRSIHKTIFLGNHGEELDQRQQAERDAVPIVDQRFAMAELLRQVRDLVVEQQATLRIVAIPSRRMVRTQAAPSHDWLAQQCQQLDVPFLSLLTSLRGEHATAFYQRDIHLTRAGHALVGEALVTFLTE